jgi:hypothetical protein
MYLSRAGTTWKQSIITRCGVQNIGTGTAFYVLIFRNFFLHILVFNQFHQLTKHTTVSELLWFGVVLIPIRIRLSILIPIQIQSYPKFFNFIQRSVSPHCFIFLVSVKGRVGIKIPTQKNPKKPT